ncbi:hypothetical protein A2837_02145 [Candidatus Kaiserbacteria bacterium RIFCSPHIGHO2_01_FULL_46_22]|uniref:Uncharacterized protein n=1 Tax=Candidatus Kaiserbacteria bacterium RIFCSPHIGHO2_01_FULL_46_22 TaxID=1798475 RepID=A0A1F6BZP8_9BACT|nr:MAG: hypothetical protein A2837_02145 [Candidatus Kaiserbacteria bacterium RIFCSPHIGHO2_01_FULL_46_22]
MSDMSFSEEPQYVSTEAPVKQLFLVRLVLATGLVKTDKGAQLVLLATAVISAILAIGIFTIGTSEKEHEYVPPPPPSNVYR